jgi:hypothetical protein
MAAMEAKGGIAGGKQAELVPDARLVQVAIALLPESEVAHPSDEAWALALQMQGLVDVAQKKAQGKKG